jgi:hypothetical protein
MGIELPDLTAAIEVARKAGNVVSGLRLQTDLLKDLKVHICDDSGNVLEKIDLARHPSLQDSQFAIGLQRTAICSRAVRWHTSNKRSGQSHRLAVFWMSIVG